MTDTPSKANQAAYEPVPNAEKAEAAESVLTDVTFVDTPKLSEGSFISQDHRVSETRSLSRDAASSWYFIAHGAVDAALAVGPIAFFIIAGICIGLHGRPESGYGENIKAITLVSPTIFPIVYAAILGKLLQRIGLYKAERGTTMGNLERLVGCQSVFSTLERLVGLRRVDMLGVTILLAWLLSPLGGQASLRLLSTELLVTNSNSTIYYYPIELYSSDTVLPIRQSNATVSPFFASLFVTAIQTSRQNIETPLDLFGNIRIPDIDIFNKASSPDSTLDWHYVQNVSDLSYTSVFGIPIARVPQTGNTSFALVTHYWSVNCTSEDRGNQSQSWKRIFPPNDTKLAILTRLSPSFDLVVDEKNSTDNDVRFRYLSRTGNSQTDTSVLSLECRTTPIIVKSQVVCQNGACHVRAMQRLQRKPMDGWDGKSPLIIFKALCKLMPGVDISATQDQQFGSELIEQWIMDPLLSLENYQSGFVNLAGLQRLVFTSRLQMAINTFWDATVGGNSIHIDPLDNDKYKKMKPAWNETNIKITKYEGPHYVCHFQLAGITMAISFILLLAANLSLLLGLLTRTPDILGFVSLTARDNPHFKKHVRSHLDGKESARALRDVHVMIGDVKGDAEVGHIALATMDAKPRRLSWTRLYD